MAINIDDLKSLDLNSEFLDKELENFLEITETFRKDLQSFLAESILINFPKSLEHYFFTDLEEIIENLNQQIITSQMDSQHVYIHADANDDDSELGESDEDELGESDEDTCLAAPYGEEK